MNGPRRRTCHTCNKTFSKAEHLTRHLRSHSKEKPYECSFCRKSYSRSDVLRRHEKSHQSDSPQPREVLTPSSQVSKPPTVMVEPSELAPEISVQSSTVGRPLADHAPPVPGMNLHDPILQADSSAWFLGADLDLDALDFSLSSAISEWAQLPPVPSVPGLLDPGSFVPVSTPTPSRGIQPEAPNSAGDSVRRKWFTRLHVPDEARPSRQAGSRRGGPSSQGNLDADETYRVGLSQRLQPRIHDEALPSLEQLNLFAKLYFSRCHSLLPIVHAPSFRPNMENWLLFVSICSVGALFVGSSHAVAQGTRLFERLNKAILASWESMIAGSHFDGLSMVQAGLLGQTFAILSGRSRDLVMADVLHGTVMAWAREASKNSLPAPNHPLSMNLDGTDLEEQWSRWIDQEQRKRVEIALNIHDAELACLLHHEPIRKHRLSQYPRLASDLLFMAPTASKWAELYRQSLDYSSSTPGADNPLLTAGRDSNFAAYGVLESINAYVVEARRANTLDELQAKNLSNMLISWWRGYSVYFVGREEEDPFSLPVLWHSIYMALYADIDMLEIAIGRDGQSLAAEVYSRIRSWSSSLDASKCLVHAVLVQRYLERMRVCSEPAIHVPRALFTAALSWFCFTRIGGQQSIDLNAFHAPEIELLGSDAALDEARGQAFGDSAFADVNHLHRLIDLLNRVNRWAISNTFASVLYAAIEEQHVT